MKIVLPFAKVWFWMLMMVPTGCSVPPPLDDGEGPDSAATVGVGPSAGPPDAGPREEGPRPSPPAGLRAARLVAARREGGLAVVDAASGAVVATAPATSGRGRDGAVDPWARPSVAFGGEDDADGGELATLPLDRAGIGAPRHLTWVDGDARIVATPFGVVVFEAGYGARWRLLPHDGAPGPSVTAPAPLSIAIPAGPSGVSLRALVPADGGGLALATAAVGPAGLGTPTLEAIDGLAAEGAAPRWVETPAMGGSLLVDVVRGEILVHRVSADGKAGPARRLEGSLASPRSRLEHAAAIEGGRRLALLLSKPSRVVVVVLGDGLATGAAIAHDLPGNVRIEPRFFSRELVVLGRRIFVATTEGVVALDVGADPGDPPLDPAPGFPIEGLCGPLALMR